MSISSKRATTRAVSGVAALFGAMALMFMSMLPASAAGSITSPIANQTLVGGNLYAVEGTTDGSATYYAIAICDAASGGTKCDHTSGSYTNLTIATGSFSDPITPNQVFANWNFATNSAGIGVTDCTLVQCAVVLSEYSGTYPASITPIGAPVVVPIDIS